MMPMAISDEVKLRCFNAVFARAVGGDDVVEMLCQFHVEGLTYEKIAEIHGTGSVMRVFRKIRSARKSIREMGLWPAEWTERGWRGRRMATITNN
jgi:hypothetical protein